MVDKVEWGITANTAESDLALAQFRTQLKQTSDMFQRQMQDMDGQARESGNALTQFRTDMGQLFESVRSGNLNDVADSFGNIRGTVLGAIGIVAGAGAAAIEAANQTYEYNDAVADMASKLGIGATQASILRARIEMAGGDTELYTQMLFKLNEQLRANETGLQSMGLQTRDASGQLRNSADVMEDVVRLLNDYNAGTDRTQAALAIFGGGVDRVDELMKLLGVSESDAKQRMDDLGLTVTEQSQAMSGDYETAINTAAYSLQGFGNSIGQQVMPAITSMVEMFNDAAPAAIVILRGAVGGLMTVFYGLQTAAQITLETIGTAVYSVVEPIRGAIEGAMLVMRGDFSGAVTAIKTSFANVGTYGEASFDRVADSAAKTKEKIWNLFAEGDPTQQPTGGKKYDAVQVQQLEQQLQDELAARKLYGDQASAYETQFWERALTQTREGSAERRAIIQRIYQLQAADAQKAEQSGTQKAREAAAEQKRILQQKNAAIMDGYRQQIAAAGTNYDAVLAIERQALAQAKTLYTENSAEYRAAANAIVETERRKQEQLDQLRQQAADHERTLALDMLDHDQQIAQLQLQQGTITQQQMAQLQQQFEERRYAIERAALEQRQKLADPNTDPVAYQQVLEQIEQLEQQHANKLDIIRAQAAQAASPFAGMMSSIQSTYTQGLNAMMEGTLSWRDGITGAFTTILGAAQQMIAEKVTAWLFGEEAQTGATLLGTAQRAAIEAGAAIKSVALWAWAAVKNIMANAWQAMAAAWQAIVGIPFVGPVLAPAAAAGTFALVAALAGKVASASGGYDIPSGINPLVQAHAEEMIIPSKYANFIREATNEGQGGAATGSGDNFHIHAIDTKGIKRLLEKHGSVLADVARQQKRNFNDAL